MPGRIFHYKLVVGAVLGVLALGVVGGLFALQFLTIARPAGEAEVTVAVDRNGTALFDREIAVREPTALSALQRAAALGGFEVEVVEYPGQGAYVVRIAAWRATADEGWLYCVGEPCTHPPLAADRYALKEGDRLRWHWGTAADGLT